MGAEHLITPSNKKLFCELLKSKHGHIGEACEETGITRQTYYAWLAKDPEFRTEVENSKEWLLDRAEQVVRVATDKGDLKAAELILRHLAKHRGWTTESKLDVTTNGESINKITVEIVQAKQETPTNE